MFKPFYIHGFNEPGRISGRFARGFTLRVSQDEENPHNIKVQGTWCSPKDQFCKKEGRSFADKAAAETMNKRNLPKLVADCYAACGLETSSYDQNYLLKFVV